MANVLTSNSSRICVSVKFAGFVIVDLSVNTTGFSGSKVPKEASGISLVPPQTTIISGVPFSPKWLILVIEEIHLLGPLSPLSDACVFETNEPAQLSFIPKTIPVLFINCFRYIYSTSVNKSDCGYLHLLPGYVHLPSEFD